MGRVSDGEIVELLIFNYSEERERKVRVRESEEQK